MRTQDFWQRLPKFDELVDNPKVREAMDRWKGSAAVAKVRTAIEDLGAEASRRAEQWQGLSPSEVIDRLVRKIDRPSRATTPTCVNATGELWGSPLGGPPLAESAMQSLTTAAAGYLRLEENASSVAELVARLSGAEAAWLGASGSAALAVHLKKLAQGNQVIVARRDVSDIERGVCLARYCEEFGVELCEVGSAEGATIEDYRSGIETASQSGVERPVVLRRYAEYREVVGGADRLPTSELVRLIGGAGGLLIEELGGALLDSAPCKLGIEIPTARAVLSEGADLVILRGDGLLGAPRCGIVAGRRELVEEATKNSLAQAIRATPLVEEALSATLKLFETPERLPFVHPLYALLDAPLENLRTRAERIAAQIDAAEDLSAEAVELPNESASPRGFVRLPSWAIGVTPQDGEILALADRLGHCEKPVFGRHEQTRLLLNLRTVFASQDSALVQALAPIATDEVD